MSEKWTPEERSAAESYAWGCQTGGKRPVTLLEVELACQRNRLLVALKRTLHSFEVSLRGKPLRDADETIAEADAAISACEVKK